MTDKVPFKNPVRVWVEVYERVLENKYGNDIGNLMNDEIGMYMLRRLLDLLVEDCTGVRKLPLRPPDAYDEYGKMDLEEKLSIIS